MLANYCDLREKAYVARMWRVREELIIVALLLGPALNNGQIQIERNFGDRLAARRRCSNRLSATEL